MESHYLRTSWRVVGNLGSLNRDPAKEFLEKSRHSFFFSKRFFKLTETVLFGVM